MKNKFNQISSKEWLPYQKSWYLYKDEEKLVKDTVRFFTDYTLKSVVGYIGDNYEEFKELCTNEMLESVEIEGETQLSLQFLYVDIRNDLKRTESIEEYLELESRILNKIEAVKDNLIDKRFLCVLALNKHIGNKYLPLAWQIGKAISSVLLLKDEKIICRGENVDGGIFTPTGSYEYQLFFRRDDSIPLRKENVNFLGNGDEKESVYIQNEIGLPSWYILKPQSRSKLEVLHPAKYPESLAEMYIKKFTREDDYVLDPMSGTGSSQLAALKNKRNGIGTELSEFFCGIANKRCTTYLNPPKTLFDDEIMTNTCEILNMDARKIDSNVFSQIDYLVTSPPYWDMLNMKGAENQAKRVERGLQTNYSESDKDMGNVTDYGQFIEELSDIYINISKGMENGSYMTIVVKNIKKKGLNYPLAWDLSEKLTNKGLVLVKETFWCQDDLNLAPYGYGNTWVSNTFHQYCLSYQVSVK